MFHPVGPQPPAVYWRRRFILLAAAIALLVLLVLTVHAVRSNGEGTNGAQGPATPTPTQTAAAPSSSAKKTSSSPKSSAKSTAKSSGKSSSAAAPRTTAAPPPKCDVKSLSITSVVGKSTYSVGDTPLLQMQVTNTGSKPCVQDLADQQVEMRVYNGESRVWGSHDCQIQPGTEVRTLAPNMAVRVAITWSGRTSQPGCNGTRQRVGAGTYTLYTALAGRTAKATQFSIS
jgi:hypothetical protein